MRWLAQLRFLIPIVIGLVAFTLYRVTLAPGLLPADSGEFQLVAATLGIAHPPGYPLYTLLGWWFTRLTPLNPAWGLNLLSALLAAATLAVVAETVFDRSKTEDPHPNPLPGGEVTSDSLSLWERAGVRVFGKVRVFDRVVYGVRATLPALAAVFALAGAPTFWAQATTANIRILVALFTALILGLGLRALAAPTTGRLAALAFVITLGLGHHGSLAFVALPTLLAVALAWGGAHRQRRKEAAPLGTMLGAAGLAAVVGLLPLLYLPLRGAPGMPPQPDALNSLPGWLDHALARGFRGDMFAFARPDLLGDRLLILADILRLQFGGPLLVFAALSLLVLLRGPLVALMLGGAFALAAFVAITYRAPQTVEYMLPAYVALALIIGVGLQSLCRSRKAMFRRALVEGDTSHLSPRASKGSPRGSNGGLLTASGVTYLACALALAAIGLGVWNIAQAWPSFVALRGEDSARQEAEALLRAAPPDGRVLAAWHQVTPLWYLQYVDGQRLDVRVDYVAPAGAEPYPATWRRLLEEATRAGPTLATNRYGAYQGAPFTLAPTGPGFLALRGDPPIPTPATRLDVALAPGLTLWAAHLPPRETAAGQSVTVDLYWRLDEAQPGATGFFVHLLDEAGQVVGQADVSRPAAELGAGQMIVTRHRVPVLPTTAPGSYRLVAGAYRVGAGGVERLRAEPVQLGPVMVTASTARPVLAHTLTHGFPTGVTLVGSAWDSTLPDQARLYLAWRRERAGGPVDVTLTGSNGWATVIRVPDAPTGGYLNTVVDAPLDQAVTLALDGRRVDLGRAGDDRWLNFGGETALVDAQARREGGELVVDLTWLALRPLTRDYTVTVKARGQGWTAQSDGTPAGGAIPTLKWIAGMRVHDRHRLKLPPDAAGPVAVSVGLYDAFTATPLSILDDRLWKLGQGEEAVVTVVD